MSESVNKNMRIYYEYLHKQINEKIEDIEFKQQLLSELRYTPESMNVVYTKANEYITKVNEENE